jgi:hypothetical protein
MTSSEAIKLKKQVARALLVYLEPQDARLEIELAIDRMVNDGTDTTRAD